MSTIPPVTSQNDVLLELHLNQSSQTVYLSVAVALTMALNIPHTQRKWLTGLKLDIKHEKAQQKWIYRSNIGPNKSVRERLLQQGAGSLSDAELLTIFRSGSKQHSAVS